MDPNRYDRRQFLKTTSSLSTLGVMAGATGRQVSLAIDPSDAVAHETPPQWALKELARALAAKGCGVHNCERAAQAAGDLCVVVAGRDTPAAREVLKGTGASVAAAPEALGLVPGKAGRIPAILACGHGATGLVYALFSKAPGSITIRRPDGTAADERPVGAVFLGSGR